MTIVGATAAAPHLLPSAKSTVEGGGQASLYPTPKKFDPKDSPLKRVSPLRSVLLGNQFVS